MKKIDVKYNADGYIESVTDNAVHFEQENDSLEINAQITTDKKVRAYIKAPNNNSAVTDELTPVDGVYSCMVDGDYMAKGTLYIGYELYDESGYTERLEPLKIYIDSFVNLGGGSSDNVYVVTVKVGTVETLATGEPATVENVGTKKDMILNFGLPRGDKGVKGDKGDKGDRGERGADGKDGINGADGKDGYTPQKGVDYFTAQDIKSLGIDDKVDKFDGKGLSTNDFTDELKKRVEENTFDGLITMPEDSSEIDYDQYTTSGIYKVYSDHGDEQNSSILIVRRYWDGSAEQILTDGEYAAKRVKDENGKWTNWQEIYVSQKDLDKKVDKVDGKGLSTNDFTTALKNKLDGIEPNATALPKVINIYCENQLDERISKWNNKSLFNEYTDDGLYYFSFKYNNYGDINDESTWFSETSDVALLLVNTCEDGGKFVEQTLIIDGRIYTTSFWPAYDIPEWQEIYVSEYDLDNAIGDVETSLENIIAKYGLGGDGV